MAEVSASHSRVVGAIGQTVAALQNMAAAQQRTQVSAQQEILLLQQKIAIQAQAITGTLSYAQAQQQITAATLTARGATQQQATQLSALRTQYAANTATLNQSVAAQRQATVAQQQATAAQQRAQTSAQQQITLLQQTTAIQRQAIAGTITYAQAQQQIAVATLTAHGATQQQATQLAALRAQFAANTAALQAQNSATSTATTSASAFAGSLKQIVAIALGINLAQIFRGLVTEIKSLVTESIGYNATLEQSRLTIASLLQGTTILVDSQGKQVSATTAWNVNLAEASRLQQRIAELSESTFGTQEQLLSILQRILAFGRGQVATDDERLKLAQGITNLGKIQGLDANLLNNQTRELFTLLRPNNQLLLNILNISVEQARQYKAHGTLIQELNTHLVAYNNLAKDAALTWGGLTTTVETFKNLIGAGAFAGTFAGLKDILIGVRDELIAIQKTGGLSVALEADPAKLQALGATLADLFTAIVRGAAQASNELLVAGTSMGDWVKVNRDWLTLKTAESLTNAATAAASLGPALSDIGAIVGELVRTYLSLPAEVQVVGIIAALYFGTGPVGALVAAFTVARVELERLTADAEEDAKRMQAAGALTRPGFVGPPLPPSLRQSPESFVGPPEIAQVDQLANAHLRLVTALGVVDKGITILHTHVDESTDGLTRHSGALGKNQAELDKEAAAAAKTATAVVDAAKAHVQYLDAIAKVTGTESAVTAAHEAAIQVINAEAAAAIAHAKGNAEVTVQAEEAKTEKLLTLNVTYYGKLSDLEQKRFQASLQIGQLQTNLDVATIKNTESILQSKLSLVGAEKTLAEANGASAQEIFAFTTRELDLERQIIEAKKQETTVELARAQVQLAKHGENIATLQAELAAIQDINSAQGQAKAAPILAALDLESKAYADQFNTVQQLQTALEGLGLSAEAAALKAQTAFAKLQQDEAKTALISAQSLGTMFEQIITGILQGTQKLSTLLSSAGQAIGVKFFQQLIVGKNQNFDIPLIGNVSQLFLGNNGGIIGAIFGQGGTNAALQFAGSFTSVLSSGNSGLSGIGATILQGGAPNFQQGPWQTAGTNAGSSFLQGFSQIFSGNFSGGLGTISKGLGPIGQGLLGDLGGSFISSIFNLNSSQQGKIGGQVGSLIGGILGNVFGAGLDFILPGLGTILGAFGGNILGSLFGSLFVHVPTAGTQIRKSIEQYFKDIKASFADQINSKNYFFEETKALADSMFGGNFLAASKTVLLEKAGPELAKELKALGTALTADQAIKLGKSVEQTGTTFGNLLIANLGIDKIPAAIQEIVQKSNLTLGDLLTKLTDVFTKGKISADFYHNALKGAIDIFLSDLPKSINVMQLLNDSMKDGVLDVQAFQDALTKVAQTAKDIGDSAGKAISDGLSQGLNGDQVAANFGKMLQDIERNAIITKALSSLTDTLFTGIDLSKPIDAGSEAATTLADRIKVAYDNILDLLKAANLLPDSFTAAADAAKTISLPDAAKNKTALASSEAGSFGQVVADSVSTAVKDGLKNGLSGADIGANAVSALKQGIASAITDSVIQGFVNAQLTTGVLAPMLSQITDAMNLFVAGTINQGQLDAMLTPVFQHMKPALEALATALGITTGKLTDMLNAAGLLQTSLTDTNGTLNDTAQLTKDLFHPQDGPSSLSTVAENATAASTAIDTTSASATDAATATAALGANMTDLISVTGTTATVTDRMNSSLQDSETQIQKVDDAVRKLISDLGTLSQNANVNVNVNGPGVPVKAAAGFSGVVTHPTMFLAGEAGPESVHIGPVPAGGNLGDIFGGSLPDWIRHFFDGGSGGPRGGISDLSQLSADAQAKVKDLVSQIQALAQSLQDLAQKRIDLRLNFIADLQTLGVLTPLQAISAQISEVQTQLDALHLSSANGGASPNIGTASDVDIAKAVELNQQLMDLTVQRYQAEVQALNDLKTAQQKVFQARLDALNKELKTAQDFQNAATTIAGIIKGIVTGSSPVAGFDFLQRQAAVQRSQLGTPQSFRDLASTLNEELSAASKIFSPTDQRFLDIQNNVLTELRALLQTTAGKGDRADHIQARIAATTDKMNAALADIDAQIPALRTAAVAELEALKANQDALLVAQQAEAQAQSDALIKQLQDMHLTSQLIAKLIADGNKAANTTLDALTQAIGDLNSYLQSIPAAQHGMRAHSTQGGLIRYHANEDISIRPSGTGDASQSVVIHIAPQVSIDVSGAATPAQAGRQAAHAFAEALGEAIDFNTTIRNKLKRVR